MSWRRKMKEGKQPGFGRKMASSKRNRRQSSSCWTSRMLSVTLELRQCASQCCRWAPHPKFVPSSTLPSPDLRRWCHADRERRKRTSNITTVPHHYTLAAFGVQLSLDKGEKGRRITWIGTGFELEQDQLVLATPQKMVKETQDLLSSWKQRGMVPVRDLRTLAGKLSWIAGIAPRVRWVVSTVYAVLTSAEAEEHLEEQRAAKRSGDTRPKLVALKRLGTSLPWLSAALERPEIFLLRREPLVETEPRWGIVTDASPKGLGGTTWQIVGAFEATVTEKEAKILGVEYGEASGQSALETLAIVTAIQGRGVKFKREPVVIRSDSAVALAILKKLASPTKVLNYLASELSLMLEELQVPRLVLQHVPGQLNKEADWLSRPPSGHPRSAQGSQDSERTGPGRAMVRMPSSRSRRKPVERARASQRQGLWHLVTDKNDQAK